jgi:hypothetical protein
MGAQNLAQELNHQSIDLAHLLLLDRGQDGLTFTPMLQGEVIIIFGTAYSQPEDVPGAL